MPPERPESQLNQHSTGCATCTPPDMPGKSTQFTQSYFIRRARCQMCQPLRKTIKEIDRVAPLVKSICVTLAIFFKESNCSLFVSFSSVRRLFLLPPGGFPLPFPKLRVLFGLQFLSLTRVTSQWLFLKPSFNCYSLPSSLL